MPVAKKSILAVGMLVNLEKGGRHLSNYKILDMDDRGILFQGDVSVSPCTVKVFIPWESIEGIGIVSKSV